MAGITLYTTGTERRNEIARARADVQWQAKLVSRDLERLLRGTRDFLLGLAHHPAIQSRDRQAANALVKGLHRSFPHYANLYVLGTDGAFLCSALPFPRSFQVRGRPFEQFVERTVQTRDIVVTEYAMGTVAGKPVIGVTYPVIGAQAEVAAVVGVSLDLLWLNEQMGRSLVPGGGVVLVLDRAGQVVARSSDSSKWLGQSALDPQVYQTLRAQTEFTGELTGLDGVRRLYALQSVPAGDGLSVAVGIPSESIHGSSRRLLLWNLAGLGLVSLFVLAVARLGTERLVMRRVSRLIASAQRLKGGDFSARTGDTYRGELGELAEAFDQMAGGLEKAEAEAAQAAQAFRSVVEGTSAVTGAEFFRSLVRHLRGALGVRCVLVGERTGESRWGRTIAACCHGELPEIEYDREGTPGVASQCLLDSSGQPLGELVAIDDQAPAHPETAAAMLRVFGSRAAAELERLRAEEALRASEARFRRLVDSGIIGILLADWDGRILEANDAFLRLVGCAPREAPDWDPLEAQARQQLQRHGVCAPFEKEYLRKDGGRVPLLVGVALLETSEGLCIWYVLDLTERKQAERSLHELSGRLLRAQDEERRQVARELHDTTGQNLAALEIALALAKQTSAGLEPQAGERLAKAVALAQQSSSEIRTVSYLLHPPLLDELGLRSALRAYTDGYTQRTGVQVDLHLPPALGRLARAVELTLFRIVQEGLTNIHQHSGSRTAEIRLLKDAEQVRLEVEDHGHGIAPEALERIDRGGVQLGVGIAGMRERARQLGGTLQIRSDGRGTTVTAVLPVPGE
jgi:PAS domain S-box-containing protein